jgi:CHAD domain-containing protein
MAKKRLDWDETASAAVNARAQLPALAQSYFDHGRKLLELSSAPSAMHHFRLETKAFRYTLELFRPCYGPAMERYLSGLREIQDSLGALNDCVATRDLIAEKLPKQDPDCQMSVKRRSSVVIGAQPSTAPARNSAGCATSRGEAEPPSHPIPHVDFNS